jgi:adenylate kinase family enzyme
MRVTMLGIPGAGKTELGKELASEDGDTAAAARCSASL